MNAREKASELIVNYQLQCKSLDYQQAKQCALIAVEEILTISRDNAEIGYLKYWSCVKSELQSL
jgi:hypothetical protein